MMNEVAPYDWRSFFMTRLTSVEPHAPLGGITNSGWRLVYNEVQSEYQRALEEANKNIDLSYSLGFRLNDEATIVDVVPGTPAYMAGLGPGMKLATVNARAYDVDRLREALRNSKTSNGPLQLGIVNGDFLKVYDINYHGGERYPHLERDSTKPDLLQQIIKSTTAAAK
jgi:predicted metalloprotease with PDZ domain